MRAIGIVFGIVSAVFCSELAVADITMRSNIECIGNCSIVQTINNNSFEIKSNESLSIDSNFSNNTLELYVNATGIGELKTNGNGEYNINSEIDGNETNTEKGGGIFNFVYVFFKEINFFGLFEGAK